MSKVVLILGTRPEAIKLAPVYKEFSARCSDIKTLIWSTGQHQTMLEQVMSAFEISADRDFALMTPGQSLTQVTTQTLSKLEDAFKQEKPDLIIVQGDTTSSFAAALAAFYQKIPVAHVEAGLRTSDKYSPYPEEMNRALTGRLADYHFAHTAWARDNLLGEGVPADRIWVTGNTVIDALDWMVKRVRKDRPALPSDFPLKGLEQGKRMVLITGHRRESFGSGFEQLCNAIRDLAAKYREVMFVYPVHLNPNVREPVFRILRGQANVHLTEPLSYPAFTWAMDRSYLLLSDSGGIQEEAPHLGKPILIMRENTERPESLQAGTARLVGTCSETIIRETSRLLDDSSSYQQMSSAANPYGDGLAAKRIIDICSSVLKRSVPIDFKGFKTGRVNTSELTPKVAVK